MQNLEQIEQHLEKQTEEYETNLINTQFLKS